VIRPKVAETTALGAAYAAGLATEFWNTEDELRENWVEDKRWEPKMAESERENLLQYWKKAVQRTFDWVE
jgi:glycerol kinase